MTEFGRSRGGKDEKRGTMFSLSSQSGFNSDCHMADLVTKIKLTTAFVLGHRKCRDLQEDFLSDVPAI